MRLPDEHLVEAAMEAYCNHSWRGQRPMIYEAQMPELLAVLCPVLDEFARKRSRVPARKPAKVDRPKDTRPKSSVVPKRLRDAVLVRDEWCCQRCGLGVRGRDYSLQHRDPRGLGGSRTKHTLANLVTLCGTATTGCHGDVESFRNDAKRDGWLLPDGVVPEEWPVFRFQARWEQPGERWELSEPHARQVEMGAAA